MARIRTIKPELPHSETLGLVSREARLLFINLFTIADDEGRARAASRLLASLLYPYDDDAPALIDGWLEELSGIEAVRLYEVKGVHYLDIPKWLDHQKIDKPSRSRIPAFDGELSNPLEPSRNLASLPRTVDLVSTPLKPPKGGGAYTEEFLKVWEAYPNKVGKDDAWKKWKRRKDRPPLEEILAALDRYIRSKPADRAWCNPATWLNQGRWDDGAQAPDTSSDDLNFRWQLRIERWNKTRYWSESLWGPPPDKPNCQAPKELLEARAA